MSSKINSYLSLVKFSHTIFAMPFALIGFFMATQIVDFIIDWKILLLVILDMVFARNAAMGFNRYLDRDIDAINNRTEVREIPAGKLTANQALIFVIINSLAFIVATSFINSLTFLLSPVALLVILGYSYTKRFTPLCHIVLGVGLGLAPIGAFLAVAGVFNLAPVLLSFVVLFWVSGFDIIYALQDEEFDKKYKLKSIPVLLGKKNALVLSSILHFFAFALLLFIGYYANYTFYYWVGVLFFAIVLIYQHLLVKPNDLSKVNIAFFTLNGIASVVFAVFFILELYL